MDLLVGEGPQAIDEGHHDYNADDDHDDLPTVYLYLVIRWMVRVMRKIR